jgi:hypothetical protein
LTPIDAPRKLKIGALGSIPNLTAPWGVKVCPERGGWVAAPVQLRFCRNAAMGYLISFVFGIFVATIGLGGRAPVLDAHWSPAHQTAPASR